MARKVHKRRNQRELAPAQAGAACGKQAVRRDFVPENKKRRVTLNKEDSFDSPEEKYATGGERSDSKWPKGTSRTCPHCDFSTTHPPALARHVKIHQEDQGEYEPKAERVQEAPRRFNLNSRHAHVDLDNESAPDEDHEFAHRIGDEVEVCWGIGRWYPAEVASAKLDGVIELYSVVYADGSREHSTNLKNGVLRRPVAVTTGGGWSAYLEEDRSKVRWELTPGSNSLGRDDDNDIHLDSKFVTHFHATIFLNSDRTCMIRDLGSTNKTWIRSPSATRHEDLAHNVDYTIKAGFRLRVADIGFRLRVE